MKPFDLEKAKAGAPVVTRDGRPVRILCYDRQYEQYPIVALITWEDGKEWSNYFSPKGKWEAGGGNSPRDLFMAPVKKSGWVNVYPSSLSWQEARVSDAYATKTEADDEADKANRIACIKISWEE